jgi:hypothetical protein
MSFTTWLTNNGLIIVAISAAFAGISALAAAIGLVLNFISLRKNTQTREVQLLNDSFNKIIEIEKTLYKDYKGKPKEVQKEWDSLLFNSIELFSFYVNEKFIKNKKVISFFDDAIVKWYEEIFLKHSSKEEIKNKKYYPEFKKLYKNIKSKGK